MHKVEDKTLFILSCVLLALFAMSVSAGVFVAGLWAYAGIGGGIILFATMWAKNGSVPWPDKQLAICAFIALSAMALETIQSTWPQTSWREWLKLVTIFVPLLAFSSPHLSNKLLNPKFMPVMLVSSVIGALALSLELYLGGPILHVVKDPNAGLTQYNRGLSFLVVLAFPLMAGLLYGQFPLALNKRLWIVLPFILVLFIPAGLTESRAAKLALLLGLITTVAACILPQLTRYTLMVVPVACIGWPFAVQTFFLNHYDLLSRFPDSWHSRMEIWDYLSYRLLEHPLLGWGLGTAHLLPYQEPHGVLYHMNNLPAAHPHNVMIELWVELGLPGLVMGLAFAYLLLHKAGQLDKKLLPFALGAWIAALCLSLVAYDFWTDALFSTFALSGFVLTMLDRQRKMADIIV